MSPYEFLERLRGSEHYGEQVAALQRFPARAARFAEQEKPLSEELRAALDSQGIERFYIHQAAAIDAARRGEHVTVVTGTASGKTLCFNVPVVERLAERRDGRALYVYPTKALAQDQLGKLDAWSGVTALHPATFDGDTPPDERRWVRRAARVVLTNPDMLHVSMLPNHTLWSRFLASLEFVVLDEVHTYRGVFGSHVANVLRRLRRLCAHYGSDPRFICTTATIANPAAHVRVLTGLESVLVEDDGAPRGERWFALWNPPLLSEKTGERRSAIVEATWLFCELARAGLKNITFTRARVVAELVLRYARAALAGEGDLEERIAAYRAGYTPAQRRQIEQQLFSGELVGIAATNALELGVDVGALDAALLVGFPGSIASFWQQAGRAGRTRRPSLAVMVALDNPLDQFLVRHSDTLFGRSVERAAIDPGNPYILLRHAACAAVEKPLGPADLELFGEPLGELVEVLAEAGQLQRLGERAYWSGSGYPAADVNIRSSGGEPYTIRSLTMEGSVLGTVDDQVAFRVVHPGAVYLHQGESYLIDRLDLEGRTAIARPAVVDYYTTPRASSAVRILERHAERQVGPAQAGFGMVEVTTRVLGYRRRALRSEVVLEQVDLDLPERTFRTEGLWLAPPAGLELELARTGMDLLGAIHAVEHTVISIGPLHVMGEAEDIGGTSHPLHPDLLRPAVLLYDAHPGGVGIADHCYETLDTLLAAAWEAIRGCPCEAGCPACIHSPSCGSANEHLDKAGALRVLEVVLGREPVAGAPAAGGSRAA